MRQQPEDSLVTLSGKEKVRKPLDPPPVVELIVEEDMDPQRLYMNSPNLFCMVHLVPVDSDVPHHMPDHEPAMVGTLCSSVHRLKDSPDTNTTENAFFIFGDVSVRVTGIWRLRFTVYDIPFGQSRRSCMSQLLATTFSAEFSVLQGKDFKGLAESTKLTRLFSEQGVRLRLRKEQRQSKRKMDERSPSEPPEHPAPDKRSRYDEYPEAVEYSAGPVQPLQDPLNYPPGSIADLNDPPVAGFPTGAVQAPPYPTSTYNEHYLQTSPHSIPDSRYNERVHEQLLLLHGTNGHGSFNQHQF